MKALVSPIVAVALLASALPLSAESYSLSRDTWERPRSAERIVEWPAVRAAVNEWRVAPQSKHIELRYPGGDSGSLWALELRDWLVSLGVPSESMVLRPGHGDANQLLLTVETGVAP